MIIGRYLSKICSIGNQIGIDLEGSDSALHELSIGLQKVLLPIEKKKVITRKDVETGEVCNFLSDLVCLSNNSGWSNFNEEDMKIKRGLDKAFERRRSVDVGKEYSIPKAFPVSCGFGRFMGDMKVKRVGKDSIMVSNPSGWGDNNLYLVSTSEKELLREDYRSCVPCLYRHVLF
tara:strand:- start:1479 stop:2003 length:525 start_codon:yes stop_codon:yes gene_type:complete